MTRYSILYATLLLLFASCLNGQTNINNYYQALPTNTGFKTGSTLPTLQFPSTQTPNLNFNQGTLPSVSYTSPLGTQQPYAPNAASYATPYTGTTSNTPLQQLYPQPGYPRTSGLTGGYSNIAVGPQPPPLTLQLLPVQVVHPPVRYSPGLATINGDTWALNDLFYNMSPNIGVRVDIIKPLEGWAPISGMRLENRIRDIFGEANIIPDALVYPCTPPLPMFDVVIMAYPCGRRCVGVVTAQLFESAKPTRIDVDINGVWQVITWERQAIIATSCEDFEHEIGEVVDRMTREFTKVYIYYHPPMETPCFTTEDYPLLGSPDDY